ncbi:MAG: cell division topological specificity factor MinE [Candidatus Accumulibacter sp.]|jgi:cell division topological specificity factor|nr:cell division topological specificity factor MinE [Accumulibacter sp.]
MDLFSFLFPPKKNSAKTAKDRLTMIIAREHGGASGRRDFLPAMQQELIAVISKYVAIDPKDINVSFKTQGDCEVMEVNIVLPD